MWVATLMICAMTTLANPQDPESTCDPATSVLVDKSPPYPSQDVCYTAAKSAAFSWMSQLRREKKLEDDTQYLVTMKCDEDGNAPPVTQEIPEGHPSIDSPPLIGHKK